MTLSIRAPARLYHTETGEPLASGVAVIWSDSREWGGIFEVQEQSDTLRAAVYGRPLTARIETQDARRAMITLEPSAFVADGLRPLVFRGHGEIDTAQYKRFTS